MKSLNKKEILIPILFSLILIVAYSNLNTFISFHNLEKVELSAKTNPTLINDSTESFIGNLNGKKYQMEYISRDKIEDMKNKIEIREQEKDYNVLINGHGTGLAPPTENDLDNLIGKKLIKNIILNPHDESPELHYQPPMATYDFSTDIYFPTVGDQGGQGSCAAWALTYYAYGYLEAKDYLWDASSGNSDYLMSPAWTFNKVATSNYGSWMTTNAQIIVDWGCATMTTMPYNDADFYSWGNETAWREAPYHRAFDYYLMDFDEVDPDLTIDAIKSLIASNNPVTFAFDANEYSAGFSDGNYILSSAEYDSVTYNHAQCIVGFNDTKSDDGDVGAFRVVNSWGVGFGDSGYYWLTYECLKEIGYAIGDFCLHLCVITDLIDYQPDLIATWEFNPAPTRMQDIITLGVGSYESPLEYQLPWYEYDDSYVFPDFMAIDISAFKPYYDLDNNILFYLDVGASITTGTISSFLIERYVGGVLEEITSESPDVPQTTPGYVYNTFMDIDHDLQVILETPINPLISNTYTVNATVINNGIYDEDDVDLYLYLDGILVDSTSIPTLLVGDNETIEYIWTPYESKVFNFTAYSPPVLGEMFESNNLKTNLVYCGMIIFFDDFESGLANWDEISGLWHLTNTSSIWPDPCHSPIHSMWFGNESTGNYDTGNREYGSLITIPIALPQADFINLEFYHWREGEGYGWDESFVYISTDGINWEQLYYTDMQIPPWEKIELDITKYKGNSSVQFNFYFDTYDSVANDYRGWLVDDVSIFAVGLYEHDLAVSIKTPNYYDLGNTYDVNATVINTGLYDESDVNLLLYFDGALVDSLYIPILPFGSSETITYLWTPNEYRIYNFTAYAPPIPGEIDELNNIQEKLITVHEIHLFDGLFINYTFTIFGGAYPSEFSYSHVDESLFHLNWDLNDGGIIFTMYWDVNAQTRIMENSGGAGYQFGDGFHTPIWTFTDVSIGDIVPMAVDAEGEHVFNITGDFLYNLLGFGTVDVWILEDLTLPGGFAWYEKSTGILLYGFFPYYGGTYNYTFNFVDTNAPFEFISFDHDLEAYLETPLSHKIDETYVINATVKNLGLYDETNVELFLYLDGVPVNSINIPTLTVGMEQTIQYIWTPTEYGKYNFTVYVPAVPLESYLDNNRKTTFMYLFETQLFDGLYIKHNYSQIAKSNFTYAYLSGKIYYETWNIEYMGMMMNYTWMVDALTRMMSGGSVFADGAHTPAWIFTNTSLYDTIPIAVDGEGDHDFYVTRELLYDLPGFGLVEVWELEDLTLPGGMAWYEKSTGILLNGTFFFYGGAYNYTFDFIDTNAELNILEIESLTITTPDSTNSWETGSSHYIYWTSTGSISDIKIELYKNDIFELEITPSTANNGEYYWTIPSGLDDSTQYQIKISDVSNPSTYDDSDYFEIYTLATITVTTPDSSSSWEKDSSYYIYWTSTGPISAVKIGLYKDDLFVMEIVSSTPNDGEYYWTVPSELDDSTQYQIKISDVSNPSIYDDSEYFEIKTPVIPGYNLLILAGITGICFIILIKIRTRKELKIK